MHSGCPAHLIIADLITLTYVSASYIDIGLFSMPDEIVMECSYLLKTTTSSTNVI